MVSKWSSEDVVKFWGVYEDNSRNSLMPQVITYERSSFYTCDHVSSSFPSLFL